MFMFRLSWLFLLILFSLAASAFSSMLIVLGHISRLAFRWRDDLDVRTVEQARDLPSIIAGGHHKH